MMGLAPHLSYALPVAAIAAVGGAVIGAPLAVIMIVIELTGPYAYGLSAMLCVILCSVLTLRLFGCLTLTGNYWTAVLTAFGQEHVELSLTPVSEIEGGDFVRLSHDASLKRLSRR